VVDQLLQGQVLEELLQRPVVVRPRGVRGPLDHGVDIGRDMARGDLAEPARNRKVLKVLRGRVGEGLAVGVGQTLEPRVEADGAVTVDLPGAVGLVLAAQRAVEAAEVGRQRSQGTHSLRVVSSNGPSVSI
jgi:hypothetical protein